MNNPTAEQIAKLPAWAREHINHLARQRENVVQVLHAFTDRQTPSNIYFEKHVSTGHGPVFQKYFLQTHAVSFGLRRKLYKTIDPVWLDFTYDADLDAVKVNCHPGVLAVKADCSNGITLTVAPVDFLKPNDS